MNGKISVLMSTEERIKILGDILYLRSVKVSETARRLKLSKGLVSKYFDMLVREKIVKRKRNGFFVEDNFKTRGLKIMINVLNVPQIFQKYKFVRAVGLYGSAVKGTNTTESDIDLWIKVDSLKNVNVPKLNSELINKLENVKILFLDNSKIEELKKKDNVFYYSLYFGSIILYGEENEI